MFFIEAALKEGFRFKKCEKYVQFEIPERVQFGQNLVQLEFLAWKTTRFTVAIIDAIKNLL